MKRRWPTRRSARCSEVSARQTWSASSTTLSAARTSAGARSRSERWSTVRSGPSRSSSRCGRIAVVAIDTSATRSSSARQSLTISTRTRSNMTAQRAAKRSARSALRSHTTTCSIAGHTCSRKRSVSRLIAPHPSSPTLTGGTTSWSARAASAALAAVRLALTTEPSTIGRRSPRRHRAQHDETRGALAADREVAGKRGDPLHARRHRTCPPR